MVVRPRTEFLLNVVDSLAKKDDLNVFAQPVLEQEVPGYHRIIKKPIDLAAMREKILNFECRSLVSLEQDFMLMISNCLKFNRKNPYYYKYGLRMKEEVGLFC
ncbi:unnamed protein product [Soboliphyme baturini]|uniref:Bromo domain-containing protein n=1 Tax=Soboliphyme baturini TaxID=241478 RepID=A0A3P8BW16_9BILA|nr:unnamed protein product [Soboliphyme baturini]